MRVQNQHNPHVPRPVADPDAVLPAHLVERQDFIVEVKERLAGLEGAVRVPREGTSTQRVGATLSAIEQAAPVVVDPMLPLDVDGHRFGSPDLLVRHAAGYLPVVVQYHATTEPRNTTIQVSPADAPGDLRELDGLRYRARYGYTDSLLLAHHTRMLQAAGAHAGPLLGAVIGRCELDLGDGPDLYLAWVDLEDPIYRDPQDADVRRTVLERYDDAFARQVEIAQTARTLESAQDPRRPVLPIWQNECTTCEFSEHCHAELVADDDASVWFTTGQIPREAWTFLRSTGVRSVQDLAELDTSDDAPWWPAYVDALVGIADTRARTDLRTLQRRARLLVAGELAEPKNPGEPIEVPSADVEIDIDMESDPAGLVHLWGVRVRQGQDDSTAQYSGDIASWSEMTYDDAVALAQQFLDRLRELVAEADADGRSVAIYHWGPVERTKLHGYLGAEACADVTDRFVDLNRTFARQFFTVHGTGLKVVAPAFGFEWHDDDAGGLTSQLKLLTVRDGSDTDASAEAKQWVLRYNEDDNAAMAAVRDGMRRLADAP